MWSELMIIKQSKIELDHKDWDCYSFTPNAIVEDVNKGVVDILKSTHNPVLAQKRVYDFLELYKFYGFRDSECENAATEVINTYYKSNIGRFSCHFKYGF